MAGRIITTITIIENPIILMIHVMHAPMKDVQCLENPAKTELRIISKRDLTITTDTITTIGTIIITDTIITVAEAEEYVSVNQ
jgi:hypothetical protein